MKIQCNFCGTRPFNRDALEDGGQCDKPDGTSGWACVGCFRSRYRPTPDWEIPSWASMMVKNRTTQGVLSEPRNRLLRILETPPLAPFSDTKRELTYRRAEMDYRTAASKALAKLLQVAIPEFIEPALYDLKSLLNARNKRSSLHHQLHEHSVRTVHRYPKTEGRNLPWEALSLARAIHHTYPLVWETQEEGSISALAGPWELSVWLEKDVYQWTAEVPGRPDLAGPDFAGSRRNMEEAKASAEYKAAHTHL